MGRHWHDKKSRDHRKHLTTPDGFVFRLGASRKRDNPKAFRQRVTGDLSSPKSTGLKQQSRGSAAQEMKEERNSSSGRKKAKRLVQQKDDFPHPSRHIFPEARMQDLLEWSSSLQGTGCLMFTPPLANHLRSKEHSSSCKVKGYCLFCQMERLVHKSFATKKRSLAPSKVVGNLKKIHKSLRLGRQEDSHEFMRFCLDSLQTSALAGIMKKERLQKERQLGHTTAVHRIFGGHLRSQVKCSKCNYASNTYDPFLDLSLEVARVKSLADALRSFTHKEVLDKDNKYMCSFCKKKQKATKQLTIYKAPVILAIHLKRFQFGGFGGMFGGGGYGGGKINRRIEFPQSLDLSSSLADSASRKCSYSLYGVLVHQGSSANSGHYYCFVKTAIGKWYCKNDEETYPVGLQTVLNQKAYILFYRKDKLDAPGTPKPYPTPLTSSKASPSESDMPNLNLNVPSSSGSDTKKNKTKNKRASGSTPNEPESPCRKALTFETSGRRLTSSSSRNPSSSSRDQSHQRSVEEKQTSESGTQPGGKNINSKSKVRKDPNTRRNSRGASSARLQPSSPPSLPKKSRKMAAPQHSQAPPASSLSFLANPSLADPYSSSPNPHDRAKAKSFPKTPATSSPIARKKRLKSPSYRNSMMGQLLNFMQPLRKARKSCQSPVSNQMKSPVFETANLEAAIQDYQPEFPVSRPSNYVKRRKSDVGRADIPAKRAKTASRARRINIPAALQYQQSKWL